MLAKEILKPFEENIGAPYMLWPDGGFISGSEADQISGVLLCWHVSVKALTMAVTNGCNTVLCHEAPFFNEKLELPPYRWLTPTAKPEMQSWHPNTQRQHLIEQHHLTVIQAHYGWDRFCMFDAFSDKCGFTRKVQDHGWETIFELQKEMTVAELAEELKKRLAIKGTVRVDGDLNRRISRVSSLWGGMGLSGNLYWVHQAINNGAQAGIAGEMDESFATYVNDADFPVIETSHQVSEECGVSSYAEYMKKHFAGLKIFEYYGGRPYSTI